MRWHITSIAVQRSPHMATASIVIGHLADYHNQSTMRESVLAVHSCLLALYTRGMFSLCFQPGMSYAIILVWHFVHYYHTFGFHFLTFCSMFSKVTSLKFNGKEKQRTRRSIDYFALAFNVLKHHTHIQIYTIKYRPRCG